MSESQLRNDCTAAIAILAVTRCLAKMADESVWLDLAQATGNTSLLAQHPSLLRAVRRQDDDLLDHVRIVAPVLLGVTAGESIPDRWRHDRRSSDPRSAEAGPPIPSPDKASNAAMVADESSLDVQLPHLRIVAAIVGLPAWLKLEEPSLYELLYFNTDDLPHRPPPTDVAPGTSRSAADPLALAAVEASASRLRVDEMRRQVERIRRDHDSDPEAAVGQAKELIESVCKTVIGMTGTSADGDPVRFPRLVKQALLHLGVDPSQVGNHHDPVQDRAAQQLMGGVSTILHGADELRNARGSGHGRSGAPVIDERLARLTVGIVLPAVVYLVELYEAAHVNPSAPPSSGA